MTDRELLELAAKAAGIDFTVWHNRPAQNISYGKHLTTTQFWNPLTDDGDALRLAVKLSLLCVDDVQYAPVNVWEGQDPYAATRRAIVRAAAEIGKGMK